jgi:phosphoribosylformimino-5-aminoimidazole carboxamide ribotide isomerase
MNITSDFTVYPAVDVLEGRVVRLEQGRRDAVTVEGGEPAEAARALAAAGARWLHLVDLDGAFSGAPSPGLVARVAAAEVLVQVGGGFRTIDAVTDAVEAGAARVLLGTAAPDERFLATIVARFGERVAVAVDVRDGALAVAGWTRTTNTDAVEFAERCAALGVARLVATATARDGTLAGPDLRLLERLCATGLPVVAAGGVASLADVLAVRDLGCEGVVVGSALWRGTLRLEDALAATVTA